MAIQVFSRGGEVKLMDALGAMPGGAGWHAIHFHLDRLLEQYKSDYQIKIAVNLIHDLLKNAEGGIYVMVDNSIIVLASRVDKALLSKLIFQLRYLYMDDVLAYTESGQENPHFCTAYDLQTQRPEFFELAAGRMSMLARKSGREAPPPPRPAVVNPSVPADDLGPARLTSLERELMQVDLRKIVRRQPVCAMLPGGGMRRVFDELYIHIAHLRTSIKPEVNFFSNRWLFKYVTGLLDMRMLGLIQQDMAHYLPGPVSINLNADTLLSARFAEFDAALPASAKVAIVIEIPIVDVFADMQAFQAARSEVQRLGYRICIDGLSPASVSGIDRGKLGADLVKIQWNADTRGNLKDAHTQELAAALRSMGGGRAILCRCDNRYAVEYGQALGISLFQGRYIDSIIDPSSTLQN